MTRGLDGDSAAVTVPVEALADALDRHGRFRVLRLADDLRRRVPRRRGPSELTIAVVDVETTGLDPRKNEVIELGVQCVTVDDDGQLVETGATRNWLEQPSVPVPSEITRHTGITDADVAGRCISDGEAYGMLVTADAILAHNAGFDRPFVDKRLGLPPRPWICSLRDIDWAKHGFECGRLGCLVQRCGGFHLPHRASDDVHALIRVLDHRLASGDTVIRELIRNASRHNWLVEVPGIPFAMNGALRERGYDWDAERKQRWRFVLTDEECEAEIDWLVNDVYGGSREPVVTRMTWRERYAMR